MKSIVRLSVGIALLMAGNALAAATWTGNGDGVTWTDGANWDTGIAPGTAAATDHAASINLSPGAVLDNTAGLIVTTILNPSVGGSGTLTITGGVNQVTFSQLSVTGTLNVDGGLLTTVDGGQRNRIYTRQNVTTTVNITGGEWVDSASYRVVNFGTPTEAQPGVHTLNISGGKFTTKVTLMEAAADRDYRFSTMNVIGAGADISLISLNAYNAADNVNGYALINFQLDALGAVSPIKTTGALDLNSTGAAGNLSLDLTHYRTPFSNLALFNYGSRVGTFGNVEVFYMQGAEKQIVDPGAYTLNYGSGTSDSITFTLAIPEPGSLVLILLGGLALLSRRHR